MPAVLALLLASLPPADRSAVGTLPVLATLAEPGQTRVILRGALTKARARDMEQLARAVQRDVARRLLSSADKSAFPPVDLCLFESSATYHAFETALVGSSEEGDDLGVYYPALRVVLANVGKSPGNLRHELVHALIGDDYPSIPSWLNEGLGSLYGTARAENGTFRFLVNYRLRHLRAARAGGTLPDLAALTRSRPEDVYSDRVLAFYSQARYVLLYLDRRGALDTVVRELREGPQTAERHLAVLERHVDYAAYLAWLDTLK